MKLIINQLKANKIIVLAIICIVLSGCNSSSSESKTFIQTLKNTTQIDSKSGGYVIRFSPSINNIPLNQYFDLEVNITGMTKQPLTYPVTLTIDAGMKAHNHGMNVKPQIHVLKNGQFKVEGMLFHMPGEWFLRFDIRRGLMLDSAEVNVVVSP